jgi:hypothetical protein
VSGPRFVWALAPLWALLFGCSENSNTRSSDAAATATTNTPSAATTLDGPAPSAVATEPMPGQPIGGTGPQPTTTAPQAPAPGSSTPAAGGLPGSSGAPNGGAGATGGAPVVPTPAEGGTANPGGAGAGGAGTEVGGGGADGGGTRVEDGDDYIEGVEVDVHEEVNTLLVVSWTQTIGVEETWLEFSFENDEWLRSRPRPGAAEDHQDVVIGVPGDTEVRIRIVSSAGGTEHQSSEGTGTTDPVPAGMPVAEVLEYDAQGSTPERYLFGSVEDSDGGNSNNYYRSTFWLYIMDRQGRVVWYYADPASNATTSFQRIARDGEYIWLEKRCYGCGNFEESVVRMTLDWEFFEETRIDGLADCIDVTDDGTLLYDANDELRERDLSEASHTTIWSCRDHFGQGFNCYTNTINWDPDTNTVFMSYPEPGTVVEVDRATGEVVGQYGNAADSWEFAPPLDTPPSEWGFGFQHFPNLSPDGTLIISSHMPGYEVTSNPVANQHAFIEFAIDRVDQQLIELWRYTEGPEWPHAKGMAIRLDNGNTLANYGTGGVIREITPDGQTVFHVKFDTEGGDDFYNKMVGHNVLIDDLYALNGGPQ